MWANVTFPYDSVKLPIASALNGHSNHEQNNQRSFEVFNVPLVDNHVSTSCRKEEVKVEKRWRKG
jgi:DNA-directed RNA polymerase specialized sigma subunit